MTNSFVESQTESLVTLSGKRRNLPFKSEQIKISMENTHFSLVVMLYFLVINHYSKIDPFIFQMRLNLRCLIALDMPAYTTVSSNQRENRFSIALRDWLLPMLMNGQATIED